jgi:hypothetical protein
MHQSTAPIAETKLQTGHVEMLRLIRDGGLDALADLRPLQIREQLRPGRQLWQARKQASKCTMMKLWMRSGPSSSIPSDLRIGLPAPSAATR